MANGYKISKPAPPQLVYVDADKVPGGSDLPPNTGTGGGSGGGSGDSGFSWVHGLIVLSVIVTVVGIISAVFSGPKNVSL